MHYYYIIYIIYIICIIIIYGVIYDGGRGDSLCHSGIVSEPVLVKTYVFTSPIETSLHHPYY